MLSLGKASLLHDTLKQDVDSLNCSRPSAGRSSWRRWDVNCSMLCCQASLFSSSKFLSRSFRNALGTTLIARAFLKLADEVLVGICRSSFVVVPGRISTLSAASNQTMSDLLVPHGAAILKLHQIWLKLNDHGRRKKRLSSFHVCEVMVLGCFAAEFH